MLETDANFYEYKANIKVIGIGDSGINVIDNLIENKVPHIECIVANTNLNSLNASDAVMKIQLGKKLTNGLGTGTKPEFGRKAAIEAQEELVNAIKGADLLFIYAGMGGGTGTGAAPVVAELARKASVLTIGIVTKPFSFEGRVKTDIAEKGIHELGKHVDTLIVIPNDNLTSKSGKQISLFDAFKPADDVLRQAVQGIVEVIQSEGEINIDFADVKTALGVRGMAVMGIGICTGENRAEVAATSAISSPMLENSDISEAKWVLVNIAGSSSMTMDDFNTVNRIITDRLHNNPSIKIGVVQDNSLADTIKVTVIATGFGSDYRPDNKVSLLRMIK
jgi:cell division protein FtsZ